eukprot:CAMPEP_0170652842 /NCGR_PEP_ID=MMETSP0224-20130122/47105_1 /TAXON_ID=285029 /ORGANISM="Togula jolla, Strain CCCM 725" /LENGTH=62 /DNA_ID=CAMNT_0010984705 /DNA_START=631 /DNA_END=819 /DNA_ORIENTATION=+
MNFNVDRVPPLGSPPLPPPWLTLSGAASKVTCTPSGRPTSSGCLPLMAATRRQTSVASALRP